MPDLPLYQRLKQRKIVQRGLAYLASAFVVFQAIEVMAEPWGISAAIQRTVHILLLVGFFVQLVIAWYHGEKGRQRVSGPELLMLAALLVTAGVALSTLGGSVDQTTVSGPREGDGRPGIAVLPCANMSSDHGDAYLANGLHEEILFRLQSVSSLFLIGRTSVVQYAEAPPGTSVIAEALGVEFVGECSVQRALNRIRLTFQLLDGRTGEQLWAERYDADFSPERLFEIQGEIAGEVARAVGVSLTPDEAAQIRTQPTNNEEAYDFFLRGREFQRVGEDEMNIRLALQMFRGAVEADSLFVQAWAGLATSHVRLWWYSGDRTPARIASAREALDRALQLDPDLPETQTARAWFLYQGNLEYENAVEAFSRVLSVQPGNTEALRGIGAVRRRQGRIEESIEHYGRAAELDPQNYSTLTNFAYSLRLAGRYEEAIEVFERAHRLGPEQPGAYDNIAFTLVLRDGATRQARSWEERAFESGVGNQGTAMRWALLDVLDRDFERAIDRMSDDPYDAYGDPQFLYLPKTIFLGRVHRFLGREQSALELFDSARAHLEARLQESPDDARLLSSLGLALAGLGEREVAVMNARRAVEIMPVSSDAWRGMVRAVDLAEVLATVGYVEEAIDQVGFVLSIPNQLSIPLLEIDPIWDPLRDHPRFQALLERDGDELER